MAFKGKKIKENDNLIFNFLSDMKSSLRIQNVAEDSVDEYWLCWKNAAPNWAIGNFT